MGTKVTNDAAIQKGFHIHSKRFRRNSIFTNTFILVVWIFPFPDNNKLMRQE